MQFKESNLLGAPFRGGSLAWASPTQLLLPLGSRIAVTDLKLSESNTLPGQHSGYVAQMAVSPDGTMMMSIDTHGRALLFNIKRRRLLHRLKFKGPVSAIKFSPDGSMFAAGVGKLVQVWRTPGYKRQFCAFHLLRTFAAHDTVTSVDWSPDNDWVIAGTKDFVSKLFCLHRLPAYHSVTLAGHRDRVVEVYFTKDSTGAVNGAYSVSRDGALFHWEFQPASPDVLASLAALPDGGSEELPNDTEKVSVAGSKANGKDTNGKDDSEDDFTIVLNSNEGQNSKAASRRKRKARLIEQARNKKLKQEEEESKKVQQETEEKDSERDPEESLKLKHNEEDDKKGNSEQDQEESLKLEQDEEENKDGNISENNAGGNGDKAGDKESAFVDPWKIELVERSKNCARLDKGQWVLVKKDFFLQSTTVSSCSYHSRLNLLVAGFANGTFGLYQLPDFTCLHLLSISRQKITSATFNETGNWLAFGCAKLGQLLVWEWRSETYVLKQQGHYFDVNCVAYSHDSQLLATGADDNKLKVWNTSTGFCFVTFTEHTNSITAVLFLSGNRAVVSASLDGTVRAFDLMRYRNFRTFTTPAPTQFVSLAADQSGEVICAGSLDTFLIYVWSMKTGRLLDMLSGHDGPVYGLSFSPVDELLASSSWDKTVRLWDVFKGKGGIETFTHTHEALALAYRPDGKQLACSTLDGSIHLWDPIEGVLMHTIEGRRDIAGGRLMSDRRTAANSSSGKSFNTLSYTADGSYILAGGTSKYICLYDVADQVLLKRFQISYDNTLDGVRNMLNSRNMTDAGPLDLIDDDNSDDEGVEMVVGKGQGLPGTGRKNARTSVRTKCLQIAPTGRSWAAATCEGVLIFSMDDDLIFDPTDLDMDVTPEAIEEAVLKKQYSRAVVLSLRLKEVNTIRRSIEAVPLNDISTVARFIPLKYLGTLLGAITGFLESTPHLEFLLEWCQEISVVHGRAILTKNKELLPHLRSLQKTLTRMHEDLASVCSTNQYLLQYVCSAPASAQESRQLLLTSE